MATVRERIIAAFAAKLGASRGYKRTPTNYRVLTMGDDTDGEILPYQQVAVNMIATVEQGTEAADATGDPEADALVAEQMANVMLGSIIEDAGFGMLSDGGGELCKGPYYTAGSAQANEPGVDVIVVRADFTINYTFQIGEPSTATDPL